MTFCLESGKVSVILNTYIEFEQFALRERKVGKKQQWGQKQKTRTKKALKSSKIKVLIYTSPLFRTPKSQ